MKMKQWFARIWFPFLVWSAYFLESRLQNVSLIPKLKLELYNLLMLHLSLWVQCLCRCLNVDLPLEFFSPASVLSLLIVTEDCICLTFCSAEITSVLSCKPKARVWFLEQTVSFAFLQSAQRCVVLHLPVRVQSGKKKLLPLWGLSGSFED